MAAVRGGKHRRATPVREFAAQTLSLMLLAVVVAGGLALIVVPKLNDARPLTVLSGSMVPTFDPGDVVVVRDTDAADLKTGDVITFQATSGDPRLTTHRITQVLYGTDGLSFITRGDDNGADDPVPITPAQVRGEVWYVVPWVGHVSVWMAGSLATRLVHAAAVGLLLYGGWLLAAGLLEHRRRVEVVT